MIDEDLKKFNLEFLLRRTDMLGKDGHDICPYMENCSLYNPTEGESALTESARRSMCEGKDSNHNHLPLIPSGSGGTFCEAYIGRRLLEIIGGLTKKAADSPNEQKYHCGEF